MTNKTPIYLDYQATTPMDKRVLKEMMPYFTEKFGNPHSGGHFHGWEAEEAVENARAAIARLIGATEREIIFTSGATESNNLAIKGIARFHKKQRDHIVTVATEHKCVLEASLGLEHEGQKRSENVVDILDVIHVSGYVWSAGRALYGKDDSSVEHFARDRLLRILQGEASGVIRGMRRMATEHDLRGQKLKDVTTASNYLENNLERMRYDEYLAAGYPIASGVIEGACRHLVKDRMERTGMRWREPSAASMLFVRALEVTSLWEPFQIHRQAVECKRLHPHRKLLDAYTPNASIAL